MALTYSSLFSRRVLQFRDPQDIGSPKPPGIARSPAKSSPKHAEIIIICTREAQVFPVCQMSHKPLPTTRDSIALSPLLSPTKIPGENGAWFTSGLQLDLNHRYQARIH